MFLKLHNKLTVTCSSVHFYTFTWRGASVASVLLISGSLVDTVRAAELSTERAEAEAALMATRFFVSFSLLYLSHPMKLICVDEINLITINKLSIKFYLFCFEVKEVAELML